MSRSTPTTHEEHLWARRQLAAAAVGLLPDVAEERLQIHLAGCDDCRQSWNEQMQALADEGVESGLASERHLPAAMIARWALATQTLQGREREAVHSHLMRCEDCRADLTAMGHWPELAVVPMATQMARPRRSFGAGLAWGAGVAALAAVLAGLILLPSTSDPANKLLPWVAPVTLRGGSPATLELATDALGFTVLASVPTDLDAERPMTVTVVAPSGAEVMTADVTPEMQAARTISIVIRDKGGIKSGDYRVVFTQTSGAGAELARESTFRIHLKGSD